MTTTIYFVTGATGFLGGEYLRTALQQDPHAQFYCLIRDTSNQPAAQRLQQMLQQWNLATESSRVFALSGDTSADKLGLNTQAYQALAEKITHIIHAAALVKFEKPAAVLARANVSGTQNIISFAKTCALLNPGFKVLGYVSTAYVAGRRSDRVQEHDFSHSSGFKNNYEATKYTAETLLHAAKATLPLIIFRPSIILGHSIDGAVTRNNVIFPLVRLGCKHPTAFAPFNKDCLLDVVSVDYVANSMYFLLQDNEAIGHTFHLTCGAGNELSFQQVLNIFNQAYQAKIKTIPTWTWHLIKPLLLLNRRGQYFVQSMDPFCSYAVSNPQYCKQFTQNKLNQYSISCSPTVDLLRKTFTYIKNHFKL